MKINDVKKLLRNWASENEDIRTVYIYGSRQRGDFAESSDLDIAIDLNQKKSNIDGHSLWVTYGSKLERELQSMLPFKVHLEYYDKSRIDLVKDIVRTAIENSHEEVYSRDEYIRPARRRLRKC